MNREMEHPLQYSVPVPGVDHKARDRGAGRDMRCGRLLDAVGDQGVLFYVDWLVTVFFGNTEEE